MNTISKTYTLIWQISDAPQYQFTKDGKCFNVRTGNQIKKTLVGGSVGYCIKGKFRSSKRLRKKLIKIQDIKTPF